MKLLKIENHTEGQVSSYDALIIVGRNIEYNRFNGIYVLFSFVYPRITMTYVNDAWEAETGKCFYRFRVVIRARKGLRHKEIHAGGHWSPITHLQQGKK